VAKTAATLAVWLARPEGISLRQKTLEGIILQIALAKGGTAGPAAMADPLAEKFATKSPPKERVRAPSYGGTSLRPPRREAPQCGVPPQQLNILPTTIYARRPKTSGRKRRLLEHCCCCCWLPEALHTKKRGEKLRRSINYKLNSDSSEDVDVSVLLRTLRRASALRTEPQQCR
jgi:hypothetical protein